MKYWNIKILNYWDIESNLGGCEAFILQLTVDIPDFVAKLLCSFHEDINYRILMVVFSDCQLPANTVELFFVGQITHEVLRSLEIWQHILMIDNVTRFDWQIPDLVAPALQPQVPPLVVVPTVAPDVEHVVQHAGPAQDLPSRPVGHAVWQQGGSGLLLCPPVTASVPGMCHDTLIHDTPWYSMTLNILNTSWHSTTTKQSMK